MTEQTIKIKRTVDTLKLFGTSGVTVVCHGEVMFLSWLQEHFYTWSVSSELDANQRFLSVNEDDLHTSNTSLATKVPLQEFKDKIGYTAHLQEQSTMKTKVEYVEAKFNHTWEAVKAFEEGEVFYFKYSNNEDTYTRVEWGVTIIGNKLFRKVETTLPWWETVSEDNAVYLNRCGDVIRITKPLVAKNLSYTSLTPLTVEQAEEILKTTLAFHK